MKVKPKKSLGQNFLNDNNILAKIINLGSLKESDIILEIGPGTGNLTEKIIENNPKEIHVVEKDINLSNLLKQKFGNKINVINKDILECYDDFKFNTPVKVFGNLPYNISTRILVSFIRIKNLNNFFSKFIFIFQKEVADRIVANNNSKNYGRLSILSSWKFDKKKNLDISPNSFYPKPKVWSSLISLTPKSEIENLQQAKNLEHITNIFFNQKRKMIKKPMQQLFDDFELIGKKLNLNLNLRPQNLSENKYFEICKLYESLI